MRSLQQTHRIRLANRWTNNAYTRPESLDFYYWITIPSNYNKFLESRASLLKKNWVDSLITVKSRYCKCTLRLSRRDKSRNWVTFPGTQITKIPSSGIGNIDVHLIKAFEYIISSKLLAKYIEDGFDMTIKGYKRTRAAWISGN